MARPQYGARHKAERAKWKRLVDAGQATCCLCGKWLQPGQPFDLDHVPGTDQYRGAACQACNRRDGAVRGNRGRGRRWAL
jgi:hypothetical protein